MLMRFTLDEALDALREQVDRETLTGFTARSINIQIVDDKEHPLAAGPLVAEPEEEVK